MDLDKRIAQFENMTKADPENEMAFFSLGGAYAQAGRHQHAADAYVRCTELAPGMSKAYQLAAETLVKIGKIDEAAQFALRGYTIAAERGELLPKNALAKVLTDLGRPVPAVESKPAAAGKGDVSLLGGKPGSPAPASGSFPPGTFVCTRTGRPGTKMSRPPFRGPVGQWIFEHIAKETFDQWIGQGTKVINELRLDLSRDQDAEAYDQHMREYLGIDDALYAELTKK
jgi:Fe-S cluster biosynthesis and repair protein YggX